MEKQQTIDKNKSLIILYIFLILSFLSTIRYYSEKRDMRENWIFTTATIESRDLYSTAGEDYKYKYGIVYTVDGEEYHSYVISTDGTVFDIDRKINVYVNPNNLQAVKYEKWETFK